MPKTLLTEETKERLAEKEAVAEAKVVAAADKLPCPCGTGSSYETCCKPYISGEKPAPTPEDLMRSRYTAYSRGGDADVEYIVRTTHPSYLAAEKKEPQELVADTKLTCTNCHYEQLAVLSTSGGADGDAEGEVRFRVWFKFVKLFKGKKGKERRRSLEFGDMMCNTETSTFLRTEDGKGWLFASSPTKEDATYTLGDTSDSDDLEGMAKKALAVAKTEVKRAAVSGALKFGKKN